MRTEFVSPQFTVWVWFNNLTNRFVVSYKKNGIGFRKRKDLNISILSKEKAVAVAEKFFSRIVKKRGD